MKTCARCRENYKEDSRLFITCPKCRRPLLDGTYAGGCTRFINEDTKIGTVKEWAPVKFLSVTKSKRE